MKTKYIILCVIFGFCNFAYSAPGKTPVAAAAKGPGGWTIGGAVMYPTGRTFEGTGSRSTTGASIKSKFEFESQPSFYGYVKYSKEHSFGFSLGYEALMDSTLTGGTVNNAGVKVGTTTYSLLKKISMNIGHVGTEYRFKELYIPLEALFADPVVSMKSGSLGKKAEMGTGYSIGAGYHLMRRITVELNYRSLPFKFRENLTTGFDDYGTLTSNEFVLGLLIHL